MTLDEARSHIGCRVVYRNGGDEAGDDAVITDVASFFIFVRCRRDNRYKAARPENLTLLAERGAETPADGDPVTASQASLNEIVAAMIRAVPGDRWRIMTALKALREHNWAAGFSFEGAPAAPAGWSR